MKIRFLNQFAGSVGLLHSCFIKAIVLLKEREKLIKNLTEFLTFEHRSL